MRDAEIDRLPQIGDRCAKIATIRLAHAAPRQQEREVEDVAAPAGLRDRLVEDGTASSSNPDRNSATTAYKNAIGLLANRFPDASARRASSNASSRCSASRYS